jgi:branched-chain amino acid transport system permease protein
MIDHGQNEWLAYGVAILLGGVLTLLYGWFLGPPFANRDPLVKASATLGFALILLGFMQWRWTADVRSLRLPTSEWQYTRDWLRINVTQAIGMLFPLVVTIGTVTFLKRSKLGAAMRALADDRDNTALLGVPVRRVEASAWFVSGLLFGFSGLLLASLVSMEIASLTFSIPIAALAAALIGKVESIWVTFFAAFVIGLIQAELNAFRSLAEFRNMTPFVCAIIVLLWFGWRRQVEGREA